MPVLRVHILALPVLLAGCSSGLSAFGYDTGDGEPTDDSGDPHTDTDPTNTPPVAIAGDDVSAPVGTTVYLDASASYDVDGDELGFRWVLDGRPTASVSIVLGDTTANAELYVDVPGTYIARVVVDDGKATADDFLQIQVEPANEAPHADAGPDQAVSVGDTVQLNGGGSRDPDGDALNFRWSFLSRPGSSSAAIDDPTSPLPRFTADRAGAYDIELVVDDGEFTSAPDVVRVLAEASNDDDCLSCAAETQRAMAYRWTAGAFASGPGLVLLPIFALLWHRRRTRR